MLNPSGIFDTHAHVHDPKFDPDRAVMLERAREAGVGRILTVGCDLADSKRALSTAAEYGLQASIGIHPHEAKDAPPDIAGTFDALAADAPVAPVAIGETGLDYYYAHSPQQAQREVCAAQIRYARARDLPLIFHQRDAFEDFSAILRAEFQPQQRGVVHCFTGDASQAQTLVGEFGLVLGIGGVVTFKDGRRIARSGASGRTRPYRAGNRLSVSRARPTSRQAERTRVHRRDRDLNCGIV